MLMKCPEPALRASEKSQRRHDGKRRAEMQQSEPGADKAHIVIERKPADANVFGSELNGFADGTNVGEKVGMRERDAFGVASGAGSILQ